MDKLRARLASITGTPTAPVVRKPDPAPSTTTPPTAMSADLATATSRARVARSMLDQGDRNMSRELIRQAIRAAAEVPDAEKAGLMADLTQLSLQIDEADLKAQRAEEFRRIDSQLNRYVGTAESSLEDRMVVDSERIDKSQKLLGTHEAKTFLDASQIGKYQARLDTMRIKLKVHNKAVALDRAAPILKELEAALAADPFKGAEETAAHKAFNDLSYLGMRVRGEFTRVPTDDPEIKAVLDRVAAADAKLAAASGKLAMERMQEQFAARWAFSSKPFEGWEAEKLSADAAAQGRVEGLSKTAQAVGGTLYWMNASDTKEATAQHKDNPIVAATMKTAQKTLDDASAKLNEGYNAVLAAIEAQPMPDREADRMKAVYLRHEADERFKGTKFHEATIARASALDGKWKAEVARIEKERAETLKKMTAEASAAWPKIEATIAASAFNPGDAERLKGKVVKIKGYYNRRGWDFDSAYHYAVTIQGVTVAGNYAPHVREAYNDVQRKSHWGIADHSGWDVIAIVEGPGKINRRVTTEWKDANTRQLIMKTESLVAEPCVMITIIGLHTGPLAVGPK